MKTREPISITHKDLVEKEWDFEKNKTLSLFPDEISKGRHGKAWWVCPLGHSYFASIKSRCCLNSQCPVCYRENKSSILRIARSKANSILNNAPPYIRDEWDEEGNEKNGIRKDQVSCGSNYKVSWICSKNPEHKWEASPENRIANGSGCPYCSGNKVCYENSIQNLYPDLLEEWDFEENEIKPEQVSPGSTKKVYWRCKNHPDHRWKSSVNNRIKYVDGKAKISMCPFCAGKKANHTNNVFITHPHLKEEWSPENAFDPEYIRFGSSNRIKWICSKNPEHKWETKLRDRTVKDSGCPFCYNSISKGHRQLIDLLEHHCSRLGEISINDRTIIKNPISGYYLELDVYLPNIKVAFEFNGSYYHSVEFKENIEEWHQMKTKLCEEKGIKLIHIDENDWYENPDKYEDMIKNLVKHTDWDDFLLENDLSPEYFLLYPKDIWKEKQNKNFMMSNHSKCRDQQNSPRMLHFFHDEWDNRKGIVKSMILHRNGKTNTKINARECQVISVKKDVARKFFEENHISGFVPSQKFFALEKDHEILSMIALRKPIQKKYGNVCEISRFASKIFTSVMGGFGKLFKQAEEWSRDNQYVGILCYADLRFGDGKTYEKCGFSLKGRTSPGYYYINPITGERKFRFAYRANKSLNMTEKEVASLNGVFRAYDLGHNIYLYSH